MLLQNKDAKTCNVCTEKYFLKKNTFRQSTTHYTTDESKELAIANDILLFFPIHTQNM